MATPLPSCLQTYRRLLGYARGQRHMLLLSVFGMVVDAACVTLFAKLIKPMLDRLFIAKDPTVIFWMPIWILGIFAVRGVASYLGSYGMARVGRSVVQALREDVFDAYLRAPTARLLHEPRGTQIARITYTCDQIEQASTTAVKIMLIDGLTVLGLVGVMIYYSPVLTAALAVVVPTVAFVAVRVGRLYRKVSRRVQDVMGSMTGAVTDMLASHRDMRIYAGQSGERNQFSGLAARTSRLNLKMASTNALAGSLIQFFAAVALALIVVIATRPRILATMSPGTFFAVLMAMGGLLPSLKRLTTVQTNLQRGIVAAQDLFAVLDATPEPDAGTFVADRARGHLEFRHVRFTYPDGCAPALRDVSLDCQPGTVTALVGRSGSGKSTLASLVPRLFDVGAGAIVLDGRDLRDYTLASLRRQVAWVGQSIALFDGTVAENIAYGELAGATEADVAAAAHAANAMQFIERLPDGLYTRIDSGGTSLSGGERQRIAIARAILKDAPILILDEATAGLDAESEHLVADAIRRLMAQRTVLVIAHHLATIRDASQIVFLDQGRIVERGTHAELLAEDGEYVVFHHLQFGQHAPHGRSAIKYQGTMGA